MKHTPGPWKMIKCTRPEYRNEPQPEYFNVQDANGCEVSIGLTPHQGDGNEGNARLIASAPELLEASIAALKLLRGSAFSENVPTMVLLRNAIDKATGVKK